MKKKLIIGFALMLSGVFSFAGDGQYSVKTIPANLLKNAHVVKRFEELRFELIDIDHAKYYRKYVLTILDENGDRFASAMEEYDKKFFAVPDINGKLYDANGIKIKT